MVGNPDFEIMLFKLFEMTYSQDQKKSYKYHAFWEIYILNHVIIQIKTSIIQLTVEIQYG